MSEIERPQIPDEDSEESQSIWLIQWALRNNATPNFSEKTNCLAFDNMGKWYTEEYSYDNIDEEGA